ncbi:glycoside hydrolase family 32 protein [Fundicoccus sp. Sow4_F4]|uniref:glycoside hydrolase family 32 protein n=1 Tax=Fundicoccus sp. Sow4_F4 TaxID=3438783 RepID=UPI003F913F84
MTKNVKMKKDMQAYWQSLPELQAALMEKIAADPWRLTYHQMPATGWLNDPNGAVQFKGTYHLYHQYVPETPNGGATHWGHKTSQDMVHFKEEDIFLSPDQLFDEDGVYSGSAFVHDDKIHFFYTGNVKHEGDHDYTYSGREQNTIHVVSADGFTVESREVVIAHADYPAGYTDHIRDPKVFEHEGVYYMILGARTRDNLGRILLYRSDDLYDWSYQGVFLAGNEEQGFMWECPDYFELDDSQVVLFSPQGLLPTTYNYHNPHTVGYLTGAINWDEYAFEPETDFVELDHGFDFYAPQTFEDESGRRILWAWMGIGDIEPEYGNPTVARGWQHAMALPRQLTLENGRLKQRPLPEYQSLRQHTQTHRLCEIEESTLKGEIYELLVEFDETPHSFELTLRQDSKLSYQDGLLTLKHGESGFGRRKRMIPLTDLSQLQIFSDTSSLEIFVNDGEFVMTSRVYPSPDQQMIHVTGDAQGQISYWDLKI